MPGGCCPPRWPNISPPLTLALRLGLGELVDRHLDLRNFPGRANKGDKLTTLVATALTGGDCIDDDDGLCSGGTASVLGCVVKAPSILETFLRSFRWGRVSQLDRVCRELLPRAWAAEVGPGDRPLARPFPLCPGTVAGSSTARLTPSRPRESPSPDKCYL